MTKKLYDENAFLTDFEAKVLSCTPAPGGYIILLDRTAFFPEGGGQNGDRGFLDGVRVSDTTEHGGEILHFTDAPLAVGKTVHGKIDFDLRFSRMQCHTGEHIVSGLIHTLYGYENVGFHLGDTEVTVDTSGPLCEDDLRKIERLANEAVAKDLPVRAWFPEKAESDALTYRSKIDIQSGLRLVEIPGYDLCACCAPHVRTTGQIGMIKLLDAEHYKGGMRIHILCGMRALDDYQSRFAAAQKISALLSAKQDALFEAVERLKAENDTHKGEIGALRRALAQKAAESAAPTDGNLFFFVPELDANALRVLVNAGMQKCGGVCAAFLGEENAYTFCIGSRTVDLKAAAKAIGEELCGRCGGSPQMICGSAATSRTAIESYFANTVFEKK